MSLMEEFGSFVAGIGRKFMPDVTMEVVKPYCRAAGDEMGSTLRGAAIALGLDPHNIIEIQRGCGRPERKHRKPSGYVPR